MIKNIRVCDGCGRELKTTADTYRIDFDVKVFVDDGNELYANKIRLGLCKRCCLNAISGMSMIAERN